MGVFPFDSLLAPGWVSACATKDLRLKHQGNNEADQPIRRNLALCSFRPLTRRRCGGRGGPDCRGLGRLVVAAAAMEWSSESATVRRHRGTAERREGEAAASHRQGEASAREDAKGDGRMRGNGSGSRGAKTALSEARTALALVLYLLALRALVQLSLQRLVLSRSSGLQGEFDARQARYGRSARPRVLCGPRRVSPGVGERLVGESRAGEPGATVPQAEEAGAAVCRVQGSLGARRWEVGWSCASSWGLTCGYPLLARLSLSLSPGVQID